MVKQRYKGSKPTIAQMTGTKLKAVVSQPIDPQKAEDEYHLILAEVENEYNDLLLS